MCKGKPEKRQRYHHSKEWYRSILLVWWPLLQPDSPETQRPHENQEVVQSNLKECDVERRIQTPRFLIHLVRPRLPFHDTLRKILQNLGWPTWIASAALMEYSENVKSQFHTSFATSVEVGTKFFVRWRFASPVQLIVFV